MCKEHMGGTLQVVGCTRKNLIVWRHKPRITSTAAKGIANAKEYAKDPLDKQASQQGGAW